MAETKDILLKYPDYEATIGIEIHVQLKTNTKIFCGCPNKFGQAPNTNICQICSGHPGTLPVLNKKVIDFAVLAGLATSCTINNHSTFARKHYFYPDLPKNYQITQDKDPLCSEGFLIIEDKEENEKKVRLTRIHIEEDAGKNIHTSTGQSWIDLNRAGTPLIEIVSYPDIANSFEAKNYLTRVHSIVRYLEISNANMEEGSFRADVNISVKKKSDKELGTRVELKNINSFSFIVKAIDYEIERQIEMVKNQEKIVMQTRLWNNKENKTYAMRSKEGATDYRYLLEPDLPELTIQGDYIEKIRQQIPELPHKKIKRFQENYALSTYEADILTNEKDLANFYEATTKVCNNPKLSANWILRDLLGYLKEHKTDISKSLVTPELLAELIIELDKGTINTKAAQTVFAEIATTGKKPTDIIEEKNLKQIDSKEELEEIILKIIEANPDNVEKYRSGNTRVFQFFIGQAMKETKGKANPKIITSLFQKHLA